MSEQSISSFESTTTNSEISLKYSTEMESQLQTVILFDWDDTLFCTKYLGLHGLNYNEIFSCQSSLEDLCCYVNSELKDLEQTILNLFEVLQQEKAKVFIVSNADLKWIHNCLTHFLPDLDDYIKANRIKIYSAKNMFSSSYSLGKWKAKCFRQVLLENFTDKTSKLRVISIGDSIEEKKAALEISSIKCYSEITVSFIEMIKAPSVISIIQQLTYIMEHFDEINERKEFLHQLKYDERNKRSVLKYDITQDEKISKMLSMKRRRNRRVIDGENEEEEEDDDGIEEQ